MHRNSIPCQEDIHISLSDELGQGGGGTGMNQRWSADHSNLSSSILGPDDLTGQLADELSAGPL